MTSALPAAASSRASKNAPAMRRARQLGIDNISNNQCAGPRHDHRIGHRPLRRRPRQYRQYRGYIAQLHQPSFEGRDGRNVWRERKDFALRLVDGDQPLEPASSIGKLRQTDHEKPQPLLWPRLGTNFLQPLACDCPLTGSNYLAAAAPYSHECPLRHHQGLPDDFDVGLESLAKARRQAIARLRIGIAYIRRRILQPPPT